MAEQSGSVQMHGRPLGGMGGGGQGGGAMALPLGLNGASIPSSNKCLFNYSTLSQYYYLHAHNGIEAKIEWS